MLKSNVPESVFDLTAGIPSDEWPEDNGELWQAIAYELLTCVKEASYAKEPQINFSVSSKSGNQRIWYFSVNDLARPKEERYNFHGQNVSQWLYAGAIVLEDGKVSRHH
jgi:hypothetical protein